jgi:hypothetical protein
MNIKESAEGIIQKMDENQEIAIAWDGKEKILEFKIKCLAEDLRGGR